MALVTIASLGCGESRWQIHYQTAQASRTAVDQAAVVIEQVCTADEYQRIADHAPQDAERYHVRCVTAQNVQRTLVDLWEFYVVTATAEGLDSRTLLAVGTQMLQLWGELVRLLEPFNVNLPELNL